jgi:predicted regulator of Ras-like GTPase activity (Roadblock/LC7/MglB family)
MFDKILSKFKKEDSNRRVGANSQVEFLRDFLSNHNYIFSNDFSKNLEILKKKHLVDSFVVTNFDGSLIVSSDDNGQSEGILGTAMLSYIKSELPQTETVMIKKEDGWVMLFNLNKKVFIVRAGSELSNIELQALAIELSALLEENKKDIKKENEFLSERDG